MNRSDMRVFGCFLVLIGLLNGPAYSQDPPKPWENPNSGFTTTTTTGPDGKTTTTTTTPGGSTTTGTGGYDKIDKVITGGGSTSQSGQTIANEGTDVNSKTGQSNKSFVDGFLNSAAGKTGVVSASAWSWTKSWKIGPDGKPMEVRESYHHGQLGINGTNNPAPAPAGGVTYTPSPGTTSSGDPAPAPTGSSGSPSPVAAPSPAGTPSSTPAPAPVAGPSGVAATPVTPAPVAAPVGVDPAPTKLPTTTPNQTVILTIRDPLSNTEQSFNNTIDPATTARAVPEDTRARFGLELGRDIDPNKVQVQIKDPEDPKELPFARNFYHIFRTASNDKYNISISYPDANGNPRPILSVTVPVYKMGFRNQTIDSSQHRGSEGQAPAAGTTSSANTSAGSSYGVQSDNSSAQEKNDLSDLYTDPSNPPKVAGNGGRDNTIGVPGSNGGPDSGAAGSSGAAGTDGKGNRAADGSQGQSSSGNTTAGTNVSGQPGQAGNAGNAAGQARGGSSAQAGNAGSGAGTNAGTQVAGQPGGNRTQGTVVANLPGNRSGSGAAGAGNAFGSGASGNAVAQGGRSGSNAGSSGSSGSSSGSSFGSSSGSNGSSGNDSSSSSGGNSGSGEGAYAVDSNPAGDSSGGSSSDPAAGQVADPHAQALGKGLQVAGNKGGVTTAANTTADNYLLSVSMRDPNGEVGQSFDFTSDPYPTSQPVKANSNLSFSVDLSQKVQRDKATLVLFNGTEKQQFSLAEATTDSFQCQFKTPTTEAYVWIYGDADGKPFSYKVSIPVQ